MIFIYLDNSHLPIPVYSYLKPSIGVQFLHHIFLSIGRFLTEIELKLHVTIRYFFRHVKLIEPDDDITSLEIIQMKYVHGTSKNNCAIFQMQCGLLIHV